MRNLSILFLITSILCATLCAQHPQDTKMNKSPFLPWPKVRPSTLIGPDGNLDAYQEAYSKDLSYVISHANTDPALVGDFTVPDPLVNPETGVRIASADEWPALREVHMANLKKYLFGELPPPPQSRDVEVLIEKEVFEGTAIMRIVKLTLHNDGKSHEIVVLCHIPKRKNPVPCIVAMSFPGNHATTDDQDVPLSKWPEMQSARGSQKNRWDYRMMTDAGYAVVTCARYDFYPDKILGRKDSIFRLFHDEKELGVNARQYTAISGWAYGYTILRELAETFPEIDPARIWAHGHSRLGKTALWTIANDPKWAGATSNCSGAAGAALSRHNYGESLECIDYFLEWWVTEECSKFAATPEELPFDQNILIAMAAPRPMMVTSATEDKWADPPGQFLAVKGAEPAYEILGKKPLPSQTYPKIQELLMSDGLAYYERYGIHDVTDLDWIYTIRFFEYATGLKGERIEGWNEKILE